MILFCLYQILNHQLQNRLKSFAGSLGPLKLKSIMIFYIKSLGYQDPIYLVVENFILKSSETRDVNILRINRLAQLYQFKTIHIQFHQSLRRRVLYQNAQEHNNYIMSMELSNERTNFDGFIKTRNAISFWCENKDNQNKLDENSKGNLKGSIFEIERNLLEQSHIKIKTSKFDQIIEWIKIKYYFKGKFRN